MIDVIDVVVPAHDEERELPASIAALRDAAAHPALAGVTVRMAVVLDTCSDRSGDIAEHALRGQAHARIVEARVRSAGAARAVGTSLLLAEDDGRDPASIWIATTDADTRVTRDWLALQLAAARAGADAVAGIVEVDDWREQPTAVRDRFIAHYASLGQGHGHGHVHGANLGVRAATYLAAGGFAALSEHEDIDLHARLVAVPSTVVVASDTVDVLTSGRRQGRTAGGYAGYLRRTFL